MHLHDAHVNSAGSVWSSRGLDLSHMTLQTGHSSSLSEVLFWRAFLEFLNKKDTRSDLIAS